MSDVYSDITDGEAFYCFCCNQPNRYIYVMADVVRELEYQDSGYDVSALICQKCLKRKLTSGWSIDKMLSDEFMRAESEATTRMSIHHSRGLPRPKTIKFMLDKHVVGQDEAKKILSVAGYNHLKRMNLPDGVKVDKSNVILTGATGTGKTYLVEHLSRILGVPYMTVDTSQLTASGYVGDSVDNILFGLIHLCNNNIEVAENAIVYLDEFDKLCSPNLSEGTSSKDMSQFYGRVQAELLKMIEGHNYSLTGSQSKLPAWKISTHNMLFIVGGAFVGLPELIYKRLNKTREEGSIGFNNNIHKTKDEDKKSSLVELEPEDLISFGLKPELVGRLHIIAHLDPLTENDLIKILTVPENSLVSQFKYNLALDNVHLNFTKQYLKEVAQKALSRNVGARGLRSILEEDLLEVMYEVERPENQAEPVVINLKRLKENRKVKTKKA